MYGYQDGINAVERCEKRESFQHIEQGPNHSSLCFTAVIVCCHGVAYGAAIDLALAADIRYCSKDVRFSIKEVDVGLAADVGTLTRLPKVGVSYSWAKEIVYTARDFTAEEAERVGFVSRVFETKDDLIKTAFELANFIATKSPVAVQSSKALFDFSRDRTVQDGLLYTAAWNSPMVQSDDVKKAMTSGIRKTKSTFEKL